MDNQKCLTDVLRATYVAWQMKVHEIGSIGFLSRNGGTTPPTILPFEPPPTRPCMVNLHLNIFHI